MADWRQSDPGKKKPNKPAKPKPKPQPPLHPSRAWKSKGPAPATRGATSPAGGRSWTGAGAGGDVPATGSLRRWLAVGTLLVTSLLLAIWFFYYAWRRPPKLPLFVFSVGSYSAPELLENPFGNHQRARLLEVNRTNIAAFAKINNQQNDNALASLGSSAWLEGFDRVQKKVIDGGGPSREVVAFYISAYARVDDDLTLHLYPQNGLPFSIGSGGAQGVRLQDALANLTKSVQPSSTAWVVLDLQLPPLVTDLRGLDTPWRTATEQAINALDDEVKSRLLVTLPCEDGQQNWLAPEFSSSFFGHYFRQILEGKYADPSMMDTTVTVGEFRQLLGEKVTNAVSNRRYARQAPVWLPEANLKRADSMELVTFARQEMPFSPTTVSGEQLEAIDALWEKVAAGEYRRAYRWDPLGYAKVESQLLALEERVLHQPDSFLTAQKRVETAWEKLPKPQVEFEVSLIEDVQRRNYFRGARPGGSDVKLQDLARRLVNEMEASAEGGPSFWKEVEEGTESQAPPAAEEQLSPEERSLLVWQLYWEGSQRDTTWGKMFQRERLQAAVDFAGQKEPAWLEIYLLHRLASDIDWSLADRERGRACAEAVALFARLQKVATYPEPELSWWLRKRLPDIERQFLRGLDWLLAGGSSQALNEFRQVAERLAPVETDMRQLASVLADAQDALHSAPHLLAWLLKEHQFAEQDRPALKQRLERLGNVVGLARDVYQYLGQAPSSRLEEGLLSLASELQAKHRSLLSDFVSDVRKKTNWEEAGAAMYVPQTFRRERTALLCPSPMLPMDARRKLHSNTLRFLGMELQENIEQPNESVPAQRAVQDAIEGFLSGIDSDSEDPERRRWAALAHGHWRTESADDGPPSIANGLALRSELLEMEFWQRAYASMFGSLPSLHDQLAAEGDQEAGWPWWSAAWQRWNLAAATNRLYQVERLAEASWGNGEFAEHWPPERFFFGQLATQYPSPKSFSWLKPVGQLAEDFRQQESQALQAKVDRLRSLQAKFGMDGQTIALQGQERAPVAVEGGKAWDGVAEVYLGAPQRRRPWRLNQPQQRSWMADLKSTRTQMQTFDAAHWTGPQPPQGTLAIRGNVRTQPLDWARRADARQATVLTLVQEQPQEAILHVLPPDDLPEIAVLMLIDCSKSMDSLVDTLSEARTEKKEELFSLVKQNVGIVLRELEALHGSEASIRVGMFLFGLTTPAEQVSNKLKKEEFRIHRTKRVEPLGSGWASELDEVLDSLRPSGDTPLYNTIVHACNYAQQQLAGQKTFIYVFSDGVNLISADEARATKSALDVTRALSQFDGNLNIFHFDFFETWIAKQRSDDRFNEQLARSTYERGIEELNGMRELGDAKYGYYQSNQAHNLLEETRRKIPKSTVSVTSVPNSSVRYTSGVQTLGSPIRIARKYLPASFTVDIQGPLGAAGGEIEAFGGEELVLKLDPRSRLLRFGATRASGSGTRRPDITKGANLQSDLWVRKLDDRLNRTQRLGFELHFYHRNPREFTRRPRFLVAEVSQSDDLQAGTYVLADHSFRPGIHFPEARLSEVPWPQNGPAARIRVWAADTLPALPGERFQIKSIEAGNAAQLSLGAADVEYSHTGDTVIAKVKYHSIPPMPEDRVVVICPDLATSQRTFQVNSHEEEHRFGLTDAAQNAAARLYLTTIGDLEEAAQANKVTQFVVERIELQGTR